MNNCYNMERQQPRIFQPDFEIVPTIWYQCMICKGSNYTDERRLDAPSSSVCKSEVCRMTYIITYGFNETEEQLNKNLQEILTK